MNKRTFTIYITDWVMSPEVLVQTDRRSDEHYFIQCPLFIRPQSIIAPLKEAIMLHYLQEDAAPLTLHVYMQTNAEHNLEFLKHHHNILAGYIAEVIEEMGQADQRALQTQTRVTFIDTQIKRPSATIAHQKPNKARRHGSSFRGQVSCG